MARQLKRLTARTVATLAKVGRHADGGNLYLTISKSGAKRWTFMFSFVGKQREAGFGLSTAVTLAEAREKAAEYRSLLAEAARQTFGQCGDALIASKRPEWRSAIHARQWRMTLDTYCKPLRDVPVDEIYTAAVLSVLKPLWGQIPETAARLRGRIEGVLDYAKAHGLRSGENPAAWKGHLALILPRRQKLTHGHHVAMPFDAVPEFIGKLRERESIHTLALELPPRFGRFRLPE